MKFSESDGQSHGHDRNHGLKFVRIKTFALHVEVEWTIARPRKFDIFIVATSSLTLSKILVDAGVPFMSFLFTARSEKVTRQKQQQQQQQQQQYHDDYGTEDNNTAPTLPPHPSCC